MIRVVWTGWRDWRSWFWDRDRQYAQLGPVYVFWTDYDS